MEAGSGPVGSTMGKCVPMWRGGGAPYPGRDLLPRRDRLFAAQRAEPDDERKPNEAEYQRERATIHEDLFYLRFSFSSSGFTLDS